LKAENHSTYAQCSGKSMLGGRIFSASRGEMVNTILTYAIL
jgi:hypothetical protein